MKKRFSYLLFIFISIFVFCSNTKADSFATGLTTGLPSCSQSSFPTFLEEDTWYSCVFDWSKNYILNVINRPSQNPNISNDTIIDDYSYIFSISSVSTVSSGNFDYYVFFSKSLPVITTHNNIKSIEFTDSYIMYRRYWYSSNSRRADLYYIDSNSTFPKFFNLNFFTGNSNYDRIYSTSNFEFQNVNTIPNFYYTSYYILPFSWGDIYFNYFYLDDVLVARNSCSDSSLDTNNFFSCPFSSDTDITVNKVVSIIHIDDTYLPNQWWYNNLSWNDTSNRYYNALFGGNLPFNANLTSFSLYNTSTSSIEYDTNILDVQKTNITRPLIPTTYNLFSLAFDFNVNFLSDYSAIQTVVEFPATDINSFSIWSEGFNNLSSNYIQENIDLANNQIQQEIINNLNGNTVSVDKYTLFFTDFSINDHGLSSFITLPLSFLQDLSSATCSSVSFPIPMTNQNILLPCLSSFYNQHIQPIYVLITLVIRFIVYYRIGLDCFNFIKKLHSPDSSKVEVIDL